MNKYETMFILSPDLDEEGTKGLVEKFTGMIEKAGQIDSIKEWGKKRLAYEIKDRNEGYYVLTNFTSNPQFPAELDRVFKLTEGVLKHMILKSEK